MSYILKKNLSLFLSPYITIIQQKQYKLLKWFDYRKFSNSCAIQSQLFPYSPHKKTTSQCFNQKNKIEIMENFISPALIDIYGRKHTYLRMSLTEQCNLRCQYCMPEEGVKLTEKSSLLNNAEINKIASLFAKLGVTKIRLTGGEPLIRRDIIDIIKHLSEMKTVSTIALTTNGLILYKMIDSLKQAGLNALNISLDTLISQKFEFLSRRKGWNNVMKSINMALEMGFDPLKINCVVLKGVNDDELCSFVNFTKTKNIDVRFIEYSPFDGNKWNDNKMVPYAEMLRVIKAQYPNLMRLKDRPCDTSKAYKVPNFVGQIGFITSMTENFCGSCNRLRLTADGNLKVCLFGSEEISLRDPMRKGASDEDLINLISNAVKQKKKQHAVERYRALSVYFIDSSTSYLSKIVKLQRFLQKNKSIHLANVTRGFCNYSNYLTHIDDKGKFKMVDISSKKQTIRMAEAEAFVYLGEIAFHCVEKNEIEKGDVISIANLAGVMAGKRTSLLIPLCHNIVIDHIQININLIPEKHEIHLTSQVKTISKTGAEMEALTAVSVAALTIYDMCKAVSKDITIKMVRLLSKSGGKHEFKRD